MKEDAGHSMIGNPDEAELLNTMRAPDDTFVPTSLPSFRIPPERFYQTVFLGVAIKLTSNLLMIKLI